MTDENAKMVAREMIEAGHPRVAILIFELLERILNLQSQLSLRLNQPQNVIDKNKLRAEKEELNLGVRREF